MTEKKYVMAIDQGTTSSRAILFDHSGQIVSVGQKEHEQIFHLPDGSLLETTIGNLILEIKGKLYTPPAHLPILDGIYRRHLLETGQVEEKLLTLKDI